MQVADVVPGRTTEPDLCPKVLRRQIGRSKKEKKKKKKNGGSTSGRRMPRKKRRKQIFKREEKRREGSTQRAKGRRGEVGLTSQCEVVRRWARPRAAQRHLWNRSRPRSSHKAGYLQKGKTNWEVEEEVKEKR